MNLKNLQSPDVPFATKNNPHKDMQKRPLLFTENCNIYGRETIGTRMPLGQQSRPHYL